MAELIQDFAKPVRSSEGVAYRATLRGQERSDGIWEGWLEFGGDENGSPLTRTPIETTQPGRDALLYWATGLGDTYFEGALTRAARGDRPTPPPMNVVEIAHDHQSRRATIAAVEEYVLERFRNAGTTKLLARDVFTSTTAYSNADLVRAFEDLQARLLLIRRTEEGNDWLFLTDAGAHHLGVT